MMGTYVRERHGPDARVAEDGENLRSRNTPIAFLADGRFWVNNHAHVLTGKKGIAETAYLAYALQEVDLSSYISGSAQPKLTKRALQSVRIALPALDEQRRIAGVLGVLDEKIEHNKALGTRVREVADIRFRKVFLVSQARGRRRLGEVVSLQKVSVAPAKQPDELFEHFSIPSIRTTERARADVRDFVESQPPDGIEFDCAHLLCALRQLGGQDARAGTDLHDEITRADTCVSDELGCECAISEEVLAVDATARVARTASAAGAHGRSPQRSSSPGS
jgi:hypothetical protein